MSAPMPERVWLYEAQHKDVTLSGIWLAMGPPEAAPNYVQIGEPSGIPYVPESRLREVEAERNRWHNLVKSLCDEWNDECPPGCDSYAHEDDCGATSITVAMRKRGEEIAALRAERDALVPLARLGREILDDTIQNYGSSGLLDFAAKLGVLGRDLQEGGMCYPETKATTAARAVLDRLGKEGA